MPLLLEDFEIIGREKIELMIIGQEISRSTGETVPLRVACGRIAASFLPQKGRLQSRETSRGHGSHLMSDGENPVKTCLKGEPAPLFSPREASPLLITGAAPEGSGEQHCRGRSCTEIEEEGRGLPLSLSLSPLSPLFSHADAPGPCRGLCLFLQHHPRSRRGRNLRTAFCRRRMPVGGQWLGSPQRMPAMQPLPLASSLFCAEDVDDVASWDGAEWEQSLSPASPPRVVILPSSFREPHRPIDDLFAAELQHMPRSDYIARFQDGTLDCTARQSAINWILKAINHPPKLLTCVEYDDGWEAHIKMPPFYALRSIQVHGFYRFLPVTASLAINYLDRFLSSQALPVGTEFHYVVVTPWRWKY